MRAGELKVRLKRLFVSYSPEQDASKSDVDHGEGVEEQEAVAALRIVDPQHLTPIPKRRSLLSRKLGSMVHLLE